jgi:hypothetical protein
MLKRFIAFSLTAAALCYGPTASAAPEGFEIGARLGYGIPFGQLEGEDETDLSEGISGMVPIQLDLGYRLMPELMLGGYLQYGFGFAADDLSDSCDRQELDCSVSVMRLGLQAQYHFAPSEQLDPWLGAGIGYEWFTITLDGERAEADASLHGFEFLSLQGGFDFNVKDGLGIGPFASFSLAQYGSASLECEGAGCREDDDDSESIDDKAMHHWLVLGIRGTFVP